MAAIDLLQQIGLNKYEAEAYYALLTDGPLTGYELGKRSAVPLSRSYDTVERLARKGLALAQPGDPPRYVAADPDQFLGQVRATLSDTIDTLAGALTALPRRDAAGEFWVLRGRQHILSRVEAMIAAAQQTIDLHQSPDADADANAALARARSHGCRIVRPSAAMHTATILLLVDGREALVGSLTPPDRCQAVVTTNAALVTAVGGYFAHQTPARESALAASITDTDRRDPLDWVAWEERKQRRLQQQSDDGRVA